MDGIDAALIETDGKKINYFGPTAYLPYDGSFVHSLRSLLGAEPEHKDHYDHIVGELTALHTDVVEKLLGDNSISRTTIDIIGFHGQTVFHDPANGITIQIGDGQSLSNQTGVDVISDFRSQDVSLGGQGAPLAPIFHQALCQSIAKPVAVLNIGGVSNITILGEKDDDILAFDTGPGNALIDDWVYKKTGQAFDRNGMLGLTGKVNQDVLMQLMDNAFFDKAPPKSLDRNNFDPSPINELSLEDGAATLALFSAKAAVYGCEQINQKPMRWLICGGGRHNQAIMESIGQLTGVPVDPVEVVGWMGDALEAQAFGFLAARFLNQLPTSLPAITGVSKPVCGGIYHTPDNRVR
jgi:anhydro-N-acetylmuramic acid kinase